VSDGIGFDFSEVDRLAADLGEVPKNAGPLLNSAVQFTSVRIKDEARKSVGRKRWKAAAAAIDYELKTGAAGGLGAVVAGVAGGGTLAGSITSEIGYNKGKAGGPLGNLREFGAPGQDLPPSNDLLNAKDHNEADFQRGIEKAIADAERKAGL